MVIEPLEFCKKTIHEFPVVDPDEKMVQHLLFVLNDQVQMSVGSLILNFVQLIKVT